MHAVRRINTAYTVDSQLTDLSTMSATSDAVLTQILNRLQALQVSQQALQARVSSAVFSEFSFLNIEHLSA